MNSSSLLPTETKPEDTNQTSAESPGQLAHYFVIIKNFMRRIGFTFLAEKEIKNDDEEAYLAQYDEALNNNPIPDLPPIEDDHAEAQACQNEEKPAEEIIAKGSYGIIIKTITDGKYSITKKIRASSPQFDMKKCENEARIMSDLGTLNSPYFPRYFGVEPGYPYYSIKMEYVSGGSLSNYIKNNSSTPFAWETRYNIMRQLTEGVALMHSKKILHRDLVSDNILVDIENDKVGIKICDFGLAKYFDDPDATQGTVSCLAPELIEQQEESRATPKSDVYSMGMIFHELAAWDSNPHKSKSAPKIALAVIMGKRLPVPNDCPPKISGLIKWCWAQKPESRPEDSELLTEFETGLDEISDQLRSRMSP